MSQPSDALFPERFIPEQMHGLIEAEHLARYLWASARVVGRRVLDAGCGVGYGSQILDRAGAASVTGIDIAPEAIDAASERAAADIDFRLGDIEALPLEDASCDVAVCLETVEHVRDQSRALDELRRVLAPDGLLIVSSPNRDVYQEGNPHHTYEYTPQELQSALSERFANVKLERQQAWLISMLCSEETLNQADPEHPLGVDARKVAALAPGAETFTLALASDIELVVPGALAVVTDLRELEAWRRRARSAEEHLDRSGQAAAAVTDAYASSQQAYENAMAAFEASQRERARSERELSDATGLLAERDAALQSAAEELITLRARIAELQTGL